MNEVLAQYPADKPLNEAFMAFLVDKALPIYE
jgi:hypothetical protein